MAITPEIEQDGRAVLTTFALLRRRMVSGVPWIFQSCLPHPIFSVLRPSSPSKMKRLQH
jgi:hypothetical protein